MKVFCPQCNKEAPWVENREKYGQNFGKSYMCYYCKLCDTYVGCHENTRRPLGTMADRETLQWRRKAHAVIDPLWKSRGNTREDVYKKLSNYFGEEIHIGSSDIEKCRSIVNLISEIFNS